MWHPIDYHFYLKSREELWDYFYYQNFEKFKEGLTDKNLTTFLYKIDDPARKLMYFDELERIANYFDPHQNVKKWQDFLEDLLIYSRQRFKNSVLEKIEIYKGDNNLQQLKIERKSLERDFNDNELSERFDNTWGDDSYSKFNYDNETYIVPKFFMEDEIYFEINRAIEFVISNIEIEKLNNPTSGNDTTDTFKGIEWNGDKTDLCELIHALYKLGSIQKEGKKISQKELTEVFNRVFNLDIDSNDISTHIKKRYLSQKSINEFFISNIDDQVKSFIHEAAKEIIEEKRR